MTLEHHAYFYEGSRELLPELAEVCLRNLKLSPNDPSVSVRSYERFGIDEARELQSAAALRTARGLFVLGISSFGSEAQQALLKLLEEPQPGLVFVFLVPHGALMPTLSSRMLPLPEKLEEQAGKEGAKFLGLPHKGRTEFIAAFLKDEEDSRGRARELLNGLERALYEAFSKAKGEKKRSLVGALEEVSLMRGYAADRSSSLKMILEHLAAALPTL